MKLKTNLIVAVALLALAFTGAPLRNTITFTWGPYSPSELNTNLTFRIYSSFDVAVPLTNWALFTNASGVTNITVAMTPTNRYFFITASNLWGESSPSAVASTPAPPRSDSALQIQ